jgi:hypothetical protein
MSVNKPCRENLRLSNEFNAAEVDYLRIERRWASGVGTDILKERRHALMNQLLRARRKCEEARSAYAQHQADHGCAPSVVRMSCQEREKLMERYSVAESRYIDSTKSMQNLFGLEFWQARRRFEQDRFAWQEALNSLESHEREHGCLNAAAPVERSAPVSSRAVGSS